MDSEGKRVRMKDIAERLDISVNAVSLAINNKSGVSEKTRQRILKAAEELDYLDSHPTMARKNQLNNICMMIEEKNFRDTRFYSRVILGIENEAKKSGYDVIVSFIDMDSGAIPSSIEQGKAAGIIIVGSVQDEYLSKALSYGIPTVLVDHASFSISTDAILTQNIPGAFMATKYLIDKGHIDIGFFGEKYLTLSFNERWIGYCEAMRQYNLPVIDDFCLTDSIDNYAVNNDYESVAGILSNMKKLPTAWVCGNDSAAIILINALNSIGKNVPDDVSIVGFDDIDLCTIVSPNLTTIRVDKGLMGVNGVKKLLMRMEDRKNPNCHIRMAVNIVERDSVKKIV